MDILAPIMGTIMGAIASRTKPERATLTLVATEKHNERMHRGLPMVGMTMRFYGIEPAWGDHHHIGVMCDEAPNPDTDDYSEGIRGKYGISMWPAHHDEDTGAFGMCPIGKGALEHYGEGLVEQPDVGAWLAKHGFTVVYNEAEVLAGAGLS